MSEDATLDEFTEIEEQDSNLNLGPVEISIPNSWQPRELSDVFNLVTGNSYSGDHLSEEDNGGRIFLTLKSVNKGGGFNWDSIKYYTGDINDREIVKPGELLIANTDVTQNGDIVGYSIRVPDFDSEKEIAASMDLSILRPRSDEINMPYIEYLLQTDYIHSRMRAFSAGSTVLHLNTDLVEDISLPLPPLTEQRKIATVLHTIDQAIEKTGEIIEQTYTVKKALMQDMFHGRHKDFKEYNSTPVGEIPSGWSVVTIGDVVQTAQYGISESLSEEGQYPIFRMNNIENGYMIDEPLKYIDLDNKEFKKYRVKKGDILFNRTNSLELVGKTGIYDLEGDHVFASYLIRLQTNDKADPNYLNYYMNSSEAQNRMMDFATKGVSQANINANSIQQVKLPLPSLEEQKKIAKRIRSIDSQIEMNQQYKAQLQRLKSGLTQDLLTGIVRTANTSIEVPDEIAQYG